MTTKLWNDHHKRADVKPTLKASLERLGLDYVDAYLVHWQGPNLFSSCMHVLSFVSNQVHGVTSLVVALGATDVCAAVQQQPVVLIEVFQHKVLTRKLLRSCCRCQRPYAASDTWSMQASHQHARTRAASSLPGADPPLKQACTHTKNSVHDWIVCAESCRLNLAL